MSGPRASTIESPRPPIGAGGAFYLSRHRAKGSHFDLRLEAGDALRSWLVPKGLSMDPAERRLAIMTDDLPLGQGGFEGTIPEGRRGAGEVELVDSGTYRDITGGVGGRVDDELAKGHLSFYLEGGLYKGGFSLNHLRDNNWILVKKQDEWAGQDVHVAPLGAVEVGPRPRHAAEEAAPGWMPPMLATLTDRRFTDPAWVFERKLDGERCIVYRRGDGVSLMSRNRKLLNDEYPEIVEALRAQAAADLVVDGELVAFEGRETSFAKLQDRMHLRDPREIKARGIEVFYYAFDLMFHAGEDVRRLPLSHRKRLLRGAIEFSDPIRYTEDRPTFGERYYKEACRSGWEGLVAKRVDSPYVGSRSGDWLKLKCNNRQEFVIGGFTDPKGRRPHLGALFIGYYDGDDLRFAGKVGTGFRGEQLRCLRERLDQMVVPEQPFSGPNLRHHDTHWVRPDLVAEVEFGEWTGDGRLRHPAYVALRSDKDPREVRRERPMAPAERRERTVVLDGIEVELSNQGKVLFPQDGYTKDDLIDYYARVAQFMLPHMRDRPVSMLRYPDGIDGERFFQKDASPYFPGWLRRVTVKKKGGTVDHVVCDKAADLVYLANLACITPHIWLSRADRPERPDRMIIDLDPSGHDFRLVTKTALLLRDELEQYGLAVFVMTTGSRGMHVVVPLDGSATFDEVRSFARGVAEHVIEGREDELTLELSKDERGGRLLLDTFRNSYGQTGVAPYAVRAKDGAPVATPLTWEEVEGGNIGPTTFNMTNIFARLEEAGDPWEGIDARPAKISRVIERAKWTDEGAPHPR